MAIRRNNNISILICLVLIATSQDAVGQYFVAQQVSSEPVATNSSEDATENLMLLLPPVEDDFSAIVPVITLHPPETLAQAWARAMEVGQELKAVDGMHHRPDSPCIRHARIAGRRLLSKAAMLPAVHLRHFNSISVDFLFRRTCSIIAKQRALNFAD